MKEKILIVGAGVCGMTLAFKLTEAGYPVTVVEKKKEIGGLARTYHYGRFFFDSGPHRFFSSNQEVVLFLKQIFGEDLITSPMKSSVYFRGSYYDWPISIRVIFKLPLFIMMKIFRDFLTGLLKKERKAPRNFREYIIQKYGKTLYELDFGPYTEKFTRLPNEMIHPDWAKAGVNRAVISEEIKIYTLFDLIKTGLSPKTRVFIYYPQRGISEFHERLRESILKRGGEILVSRVVDSLLINDRRIKEIKLRGENRARNYDIVVWTAPLNELNDLVGIRRYDLNYLNIIIFNICLRGRPRLNYQWIYYVDKEIIFNRLYNTVLFSPKNAPAGFYGLCVEVTCKEEDEIWKNPSAFIPKVIDSLLKVKLIESEEEIIAINFERLENAYPLYKTNYRKELKENLESLYKIENLILAGRSGLFWYNNMDHSIENAFKVKQNIIHKKREIEVIKFWE